MRSVNVVLPASMCAAMPMLRVFSSGNARSGELRFVDISNGVRGGLESKMCEGAVSLRHLVGVVALLNRVPLPCCGFLKFSRERLLERSLASGRVADDPTKGQRH